MIYVTLTSHQGPLTESRLSSAAHRQKIVMSSSIYVHYNHLKVFLKKHGNPLFQQTDFESWSTTNLMQLCCVSISSSFPVPCETVFQRTALKYFQKHQGHWSSFQPFELTFLLTKACLPVFKSIAATGAVGAGSAS